MKFFSLLTLGALLSAANALPTASRRFIPPSLRHVGSNSTNATLSSYNATSFTFIADSNFTEIQSQPLVASGQKFYIGGNSSTYCPDVVRPCPKGGETVIYPKGSLVCTPLLPHICFLCMSDANKTRTSPSQAASKSTSRPTEP